MQHHGADDDDEGQRHQQLGLFEVALFELDREQRADRGGDDAARCDPGQQAAFLPGQAGTPGAVQHLERTGNELDGEKHTDDDPAHLLQVVEVESGREQDEEHRYEQQGQAFLERQDFVDRYAAAVAEVDAHHGDGEQAGFFDEGVRYGEGAEHRGERDRVVQIGGKPVAAQGLTERVARRKPRRRTHCDHADEGEHRGTERIARPRGHHEFKHQHCEQGADGIDDDAFPAQDIGDIGGRPHGAQHGHDDGRTGHHHEGAKQGGEFPAQISDQARGDGGHRPGDEGAAGDETPYHRLDAANFGELQGQAAFEQDHRDRQRHEGEQQGAKQRIRIEPAGDRPDHDTGQEQEYDRR